MWPREPSRIQPHAISHPELKALSVLHTQLLALSAL